MQLRVTQSIRLPYVLFKYVALSLLLAAGLLTACSDAVIVELEGTVTDAYTENPVESAQVAIGETTLETDDSGVYSTTEWLGAEQLEVSAPGYENVVLKLDPEQAEQARAALPADSENVMATVLLDVELRPTTLQGTVTDAYSDEPVAGAEVTTAVSPTLTTTTDAEGRYTLEGLPEAFTLAVEAPDYAAAEAELSRTTSHDVTLRPNVLTGTVSDQYSGEPIADVDVSVGSASTTTDVEGTYRVEGVPEDAEVVEFLADGYALDTQPLEDSTSVDAVLRPDMLEAALIDQESGDPIRFATIIATETISSTAVTSTRIDRQNDGSFTLNDMPETGYLQVLAPGYRKAVLDIAPGAIPAEIELEPFYAKALYIKTTTAAYLPERMEKFYDLLDDTELNALVIDLKSDNLADLGLIYYESEVPIIQELGTSADLMDIEGILAEAKKRNIYTIARIHVFSHDNLLAETKPEWAAQNANGCVPNETRKCNGDVFYADWDVAWLDPWNRNVWDYNIQLGLEAARMGFDEIQFDYIRFPNDASEIEFMELSQPSDWNDPEIRQAMYENIATLMEQAHEEFNNAGAFFSVDIFGYAIWSPQPNIGQRADLMADHADYIYPMVYPSHFWTNELGFENAAAHPYEIIAESMERGYDMIGDQRARMRPWLQDFTLIWVPDHLIVEYDIPEVRAQIDATEDAEYTAGWAVWDPDNEYTLGAFEPESSE